jgi:uncharacterized protein (TIGR03437 family)
MRLLKFGVTALGSAVLLAAAPAITGIYNAGMVPPGLPNSGIAQGAIFTISGTGLGPATLQQPKSYPWPSTQGLDGTTVQVKAGTKTETCIMVYTSSTQVAAILPSATPVGSGELSITYEGETSSASIQVLIANFGTFTLNKAGSGPGVFNDLSNNSITMIHPAHPGETVVLSGSGLGAMSGNEAEPPAQVDLGTGVEVFVGNQPAKVLYGGRGSSPGLDQIHFVVPSGISTGCRSSVAVLVKGVTGNVTTMAIAPAGQATCGDTYGALTATNLQKAIKSGSLNIGVVQLSHVGSGNDVLLAGFGSFPLKSLIQSYGGSFGPSIGSCTAYEISGSRLLLSDPIQPTYLDAGSDLVITGPSGTKTISATSKGEYPATLATPPSVYIEPGSYSVGNGSGGANVASFDWDLTLPSYVVPTNIPKSVNRAKDLTLAWTGGSQYPVVTIFGYNGLIASTGQGSYVEFICNADGSAGEFTIPSVILNLLPANGYGSFGVPGVNLQIAGDSLAHFTVAGSPGLDVGTFDVLVSHGGVAKIQ